MLSVILTEAFCLHCKSQSLQCFAGQNAVFNIKNSK